MSGTQQGDHLSLTKQRLTVGTNQECDVSFSPRQHPGAKGKRAELVADEYGWRIHNNGEGDWYVNQDVLPPAAALPLRSGDIIRMSAVGPDLRFAIVPDERPLTTRGTPARVSPDEQVIVEEQTAARSTVSQEGSLPTTLLES